MLNVISVLMEDIKYMSEQMMLFTKSSAAWYSFEHLNNMNITEYMYCPMYHNSQAPVIYIHYEG